jgi:hypothetical protein
VGAGASGIGSRIRSLLGCQRARIEYPAAEYQLDDPRVRLNSFPGVSANQQRIARLPACTVPISWSSFKARALLRVAIAKICAGVTPASIRLPRSEEGLSGTGEPVLP